MLDLVEMAVNNAHLVDSDYSPYYPTHGFHPTFYGDLTPFRGPTKRLKERPQQFLDRLFADWKHVTNLFRTAQDRYINRQNLRRSEHEFQVGDLVLVSARHHPRNQLRKPGPLAPKATGPYEITEKIGPTTFRLDLPAEVSRRFHNAFHASDLIPYVLRLPEEPEPPPPQPGDESSAPGGPPNPPADDGDDSPWRPLSPD